MVCSKSDAEADCAEEEEEARRRRSFRKIPKVTAHFLGTNLSKNAIAALASDGFLLLLDEAAVVWSITRRHGGDAVWLDSSVH
jgi:hypothetical protein